MASKQNKTVVNLDDEFNDKFAKYLKSKRHSNSNTNKRKNFGEPLKGALEEQRRVQL